MFFPDGRPAIIMRSLYVLSFVVHADPATSPSQSEGEGMRDFVRFAFRAVRSQPVQTVAGVAMTAAGINYNQWLAAIWNSPRWWATNHISPIGVARGRLTDDRLYFLASG